MTQSSESSEKFEKPAAVRRKKGFILLGCVVLVCAVAWGIYWFFWGSYFIETDNAYTAVEVAQVTPSTGGTVQEVRVVDTQRVKEGEILVVIDEVDARLALAQAKADAEHAVAELAIAESDYARAKIDLKRRQALVRDGSVSGDELTRAQNAFSSGKASIQAAKAAIEQAKARVDQAEVDFGRTTVRAPVDGVVAKRSVQVGQRVAAGDVLLSVVPVQEMHVNANFKEGQLERVRAGQKAKLYADLYGSSVIYTGIVEGFSGGTGSAFAIIPAQNATGNWIKVVQRLPVRIRLDPEELKANPLSVGLSMTVTVDTRDAP
ncbi:HlyD family secretion protein [Oxalobacter vibrioformis]|uniref:HlyD family secretion protein n=1 Tax=Oxalobacter vibrioformis TaxID=933080 RepID=A0A9E9LWH6_9BURK|nr:HlyD family secretion protein [Oxalobacter vibrioformis]WAW10129.1 HlyD family secretion protein [Oxalobacter vibrioformis]